MKIKAEYVFEMKCVNKSLQSLILELEDHAFDRSSIELFIKNSNLILIITSKDLTSMRSALNTWLRLIQITQELYSVKELMET
ncbi:MAG: hypothetical protein LRZ92_02130 [Methanosarcinaceae archaeon]|nr:hypothetical protein [Methanosarcinaceae archaeon]